MTDLDLTEAARTLKASLPGGYLKDEELARGAAAVEAQVRERIAADIAALPAYDHIDRHALDQAERVARGEQP